MGWKETYASKLTSMDEAAKVVKSGDTVIIAHAVGEPVALIDKMVDYAVAADLHDIKIHQMVAMGHGKYGEPGMEKHFDVNPVFLGGSTRDVVNSGRGNFTPCFFYQVPELFTTDYAADVLFCTVSKPDKNGFCSFGTSCDYTKPAAECPKTKVVAVVNPNMPRAMGDNFIHVDNIDVIVEDDAPIPALPIAKIGDTEKAIGEKVASLIKDGDCLQLGIGSIPDAVLTFLGGKKDLGIHSEMVSDGVVDLYEKGIITCKAKNFHKDKMVITFLMGTQKLYEFADDNPVIEMMPVDFVNNPMVIGQNDNMVSINAALQVDLQGQVCAEAMGLKQFSGIGGQVDFIRGAAYSKGGRAILAFPATAKGGTISKIVPFLTEGSPVTTSRCDVDYIVTEYGIAKMKGRTLRERARQLIGLAAPQFRDDPAVEFEKRFAEKY